MVAQQAGHVAGVASRRDWTASAVRPLAGPGASSLQPADACPGGEVLAVGCDARFESGPTGPPPVDGSRPGALEWMDGASAPSRQGFTSPAAPPASNAFRGYRMVSVAQW